jgi:methionine-rich copper-binding protein CopC
MKHLIKLSSSLALVVFASSAFAHAKLQNSTPANGSTVSPAPSELRFEYNEAVEPALSSVKVLGPGSQEATAYKTQGANDDDKVLLIKVPKLAAGAYRADWSAVGHDGHHMKGTVKFTVK